MIGAEKFGVSHYELQEKMKEIIFLKKKEKLTSLVFCMQQKKGNHFINEILQHTISTCMCISSNDNYSLFEERNKPFRLHSLLPISRFIAAKY